MLQALLKSKLNQYLIKSPFEIEDLLTSVVFGSCQYVPPELGLIPFLAKARSDPTTAKMQIVNLLGEIISVEYEFWPYWCAISAPNPMLANSPIEFEQSTDKGDHISAASEEICGSIPELLLKFKRTDGRNAWILIEAKLFSGKSSFATTIGPVSDQLGKYWLQLKIQAEKENAEPLAIIYVTKGIFFPTDEIQTTQKELVAKGHSQAPLLWLSWRDFTDCVKQPPPILEDVISLLRDKWQLVYVEMEKWPKLPEMLPLYTFSDCRTWPVRANRISDWSFNTCWEWPFHLEFNDWQFHDSWNWISTGLAKPIWYCEKVR